MKPLTITVMFGGRSQEHESSLASSRYIIETLRKNPRYRVIPIGISRNGKWFTGNNAIERFLEGKTNGLQSCALALDTSRELLIFDHDRVMRQKIDVVFPWILGPNGEDGTLQGMLEISDIPYVGCGIYASSVSFDKSLTKEIMAGAGIPQVSYLVVTKKTRPEKFPPLPFFVKPSSAGSSIGISKVKKMKDAEKALKEAFQFGDKVIIEEAVPHLREIECAVLGDEENLIVSLPGEVHYEGEFYDYHAKYVSNYWEIDIPPKLPKAKITKIRRLAEKVFRTVHGTGAARIDFLMNGKTGKIYFNELNTVPNFRPISCYPTLLKKSGYSYSRIIETLIRLAIKTHAKKHNRTLNFSSGTDWFKK